MPYPFNGTESVTDSDGPAGHRYADLGYTFNALSQPEAQMDQVDTQILHLGP